MERRARLIPIYDDITLVDDHGESTFYIVTGERAAMLIDTANGVESVVDIAREVTSLPLVAVNTHGHGDHIGGNIFVDEAYIHPDDMSLYKSSLEWPEIKEAIEKSGRKPCNMLPLSVGQVFDLGNHALEVVDLKGHTPGSVGLIDRKRRVLFSGDAINAHTWMQIGHSLPIAVLEASLDALLRERGDAFDHLLTGHGQGLEDKQNAVDLLNACRELMRGETENDVDYPWFAGVARAHFFGKDNAYRLCYEPSKLMKPADIYLYGQVLYTHSTLLAGKYPAPDGYAEIDKIYHLIGGETGVCAALLSNLGCACRVDGNFLGRATRKPITEYFKDKSVDLCLMTKDDTFDGEQDYVIIDSDTRTCFGQFGAYFTDTVKRWRTPNIQDLSGCKVAAVDPFFPETSERVAKLCVEAGIPYVTLDCRHDSSLHAHSAINAVSAEYLRNEYPGEGMETLLTQYMENSKGLTIFTRGAKDTLYGRKGQPIKRFAPYPVRVESTLGAGDCFKAGCVYALYKGMSDEETVAFACATAGCACERFPIPLNLPTLERIEAVQALRK